MNEIPKTSIPQQAQQPQKIENVKPENVQDTQSTPVIESQTKEINEIPDHPADRASVKADNLENDIKVFASNPELAAKALEVAELVEKKYEASGVKDAQMKALAVGKAFVEEFQ